MSTRIVLGLFMTAAAAGVFWLDWHLGSHGSNGAMLPLTVLTALVAVVAVLELDRMARAAGASVLRASAMVGTLTLATIPPWRRFLDVDVVSGATVAGLWIAVMFLEQMVRYRTVEAIKRIGFTCLTVVYLGVGLNLLLLIRSEYGLGMLILFLAAVKMTDVGAYFTGSAIGKHKMIPWLSPGKSWEGLAGGLVAAAGTAVLGRWLLCIGVFGPLTDTASLGKTMLFGAIVGATGQFADLCESLLKRSVNIKDSGALVPEFGGILDIIDSPLLSAPVAMLLLALL